MKTIVAAIGLFGLAVTPALAHDKAPETPKMCEMMHNGQKMQGMMMKGKDGKMTCQMMNGQQQGAGPMDHSQMNHSMMNQGEGGQQQHQGHQPK
ncbi:hypothetical protein [Novosphingobium sp. PC22D]|uniref:hypothetical protein n=1 Tax=Novosphingobium sp. PC22D TaxID=1962403 RepID=UPI0011454158|nr:hypothetical protein [Novosphingobium sp. PC22D]